VRFAAALVVLLLAGGCGQAESKDEPMRHPQLKRAADEARAAVQAGLAAIPAEALVEVMDQYDEESPCQEPPDDGPDGGTQWTVSKRAFVKQGTNMDALLDNLRTAYAAAAGWRPVFDKPGTEETRVQVRRDDVTVTFGIGRDGDNPQSVIGSTTRCFRNGG
jgi:hypothetical protein